MIFIFQIRYIILDEEASTKFSVAELITVFAPYSCE